MWRGWDGGRGDGGENIISFLQEIYCAYRLIVSYVGVFKSNYSVENRSQICDKSQGSLYCLEHPMIGSIRPVIDNVHLLMKYSFKKHILDLFYATNG